MPWSPGGPSLVFMVAELGGGGAGVGGGAPPRGVGWGWVLAAGVGSVVAAGVAWGVAAGVGGDASTACEARAIAVGVVLPGVALLQPDTSITIDIAANARHLKRRDRLVVRMPAIPQVASAFGTGFVPSVINQRGDAPRVNV